MQARRSRAAWQLGMPAIKSRCGPLGEDSTHSHISNLGPDHRNLVYLCAPGRGERSTTTGHPGVGLYGGCIKNTLQRAKRVPNRRPTQPEGWLEQEQYRGEDNPGDWVLLP
ncbi:hypothetical protein NDU88_001849 [Pleurodeles waltl]|uniref:Uncharacterized protein n=1 Tax=Pleurodeles waltl TaxID=8319 RepID=A0AAV7U9L8_PLEWA|nr:hypothetical protein NDU88_001849 [Pleurodeles waltl]